MGPDGKTSVIIKKIMVKTAKVAKLYEEERKRCDEIRIQQLTFIKEFEDEKDKIITAAVDEAVLKERVENTPNYLRSALDKSQRAHANQGVDFEKLKGKMKRLKIRLGNMELDKSSLADSITLQEQLNFEDQLNTIKIKMEEGFRIDQETRQSKHQDELLKMNKTILELERRINVKHLSEDHDEKAVFLTKMQTEGFEPSLELTEGEAWASAFDKLYKKFVKLESQVFSQAGQPEPAKIIFSETFKKRLFEALTDNANEASDIEKKGALGVLNNTVQRLKDTISQQQEKLTNYSLAVNANDELRSWVKMNILLEDWVSKDMPGLFSRLFGVDVEESAKNEVHESLKRLYATRPNHSKLLVMVEETVADKAIVVDNSTQTVVDADKDIAAYVGTSVDVPLTPQQSKNALNSDADISITLENTDALQPSQFYAGEVGIELPTEEHNSFKTRNQENTKQKMLFSDEETKEERDSAVPDFGDLGLERSSMHWLKKLQKLRSELNEERERNILSNMRVKDLETKLRLGGNRGIPDSLSAGDSSHTSASRKNDRRRGGSTPDNSKHYWYGCGRCQRQIKEMEAQLQRCLSEKKQSAGLFLTK
jgi:hypothetical protein